jgi:hypothetical protein
MKRTIIPVAFLSLLVSQCGQKTKNESEKGSFSEIQFAAEIRPDAALKDEAKALPEQVVLRVHEDENGEVISTEMRTLPKMIDLNDENAFDLFESGEPVTSTFSGLGDESKVTSAARVLGYGMNSRGFAFQDPSFNNVSQFGMYGNPGMVGHTNYRQNTSLQYHNSVVLNQNQGQWAAPCSGSVYCGYQPMVQSQAFNQNFHYQHSVSYQANSGYYAYQPVQAVSRPCACCTSTVRTCCRQGLRSIGQGAFQTGPVRGTLRLIANTIAPCRRLNKQLSCSRF